MFKFNNILSKAVYALDFAYSLNRSIFLYTPWFKWYTFTSMVNIKILTSTPLFFLLFLTWQVLVKMNLRGFCIPNDMKVPGSVPRTSEWIHARWQMFAFLITVKEICFHSSQYIRVKRKNLPSISVHDKCHFYVLK